MRCRSGKFGFIAAIIFVAVFLLGNGALAHLLRPSGMFATNRSIWFTNNSGNQTILDGVNARGEVTERVWLNADGRTNRSQLLDWDYKGRLVDVYEIDSQNRGYYWQAGYDALNRRGFSGTLTFTNGLYYGVPEWISEFYDPEVEFLQLGTYVNGQETWGIYGPDLSGRYGGMNGVGGLDAVVDGLGIVQPVLGDLSGNLHGYYDPVTASISWNRARPAAYGGVPGYRPPGYDFGGNFVESSAWRGVWPDSTGYYCRGRRYYDPVSGQWLSSDPIWNGADPNYYTFCGGDPINFFDPFGLCPEPTRSHSGGMFAIYDESIEDPVLADVNRRANQQIQARSEARIGQEAALERELSMKGIEAAPFLAAANPAGALLLMGLAYDQANPIQVPDDTKIGVVPPFLLPTGAESDPVFELSTGESGAANRATFETYKDSLRAQMSKPAASDPELSSLLDRLYRPNAQVGSGSTAAAVRQELATGQPVGGAFHSQKAQESITALERWLNNNPTAAGGDRAAAENVIRDMQNALNGH